MVSLKKALEKLHSNKQLRIGEGKLIAKQYFGRLRIRGSHNIYSLPWEGALFNIQSDK